MVNYTRAHVYSLYVLYVHFRSSRNRTVPSTGVHCQCQPWLPCSNIGHITQGICLVMITFHPYFDT